MKLVNVTESNIKGYHVYKVRPHPDIKMVVEKDIHNSYDPYAMLVTMPQLKDITSELHKSITKASKGKEKEQTVEQIAGKHVGRVPANVCKLFNKLLLDGDVKEITCRSVEKPTLSRIPAPEQSFKRKPKGIDRRGGGAVIPRYYTLSCYESSYKKVIEYLNEALSSCFFQGTEKVEVHFDNQTCPWR